MKNRFKGLDLIDRVPDELWMEVLHIVQETGIKTIPKKKKCKKVKWLSEEALQIAVKRREVKSKGEKERYTHLNPEFQRIARRNKKAFLSDQWIVSTFPFITASLKLSFTISTKIKLLQKSNKYLLTQNVYRASHF